MKKIKILSVFFILLLTIFSLLSLNINAEEGRFIVNNGPVPTYYQIDGEYTWKDYIEKYNPEGFTYSSDGVYLFTYPIVCLSLPLDDGRFPLPTDYIQTTYTYDMNPCEHEYSYLVSGTYPCQYKTTIYTCSECGHVYSTSSEPSIEHNYEINLDTYIPSSCGVKGYAEYECVYCGLYYSDGFLELNPDNHNNVINATCEESSYCADCGVIFSEPLGHDLNLVGKCNREGCDYSALLDLSQTLKENVDNGTSSAANTVASVASLFVGFMACYYIIKLATPFILKAIESWENKKHRRYKRK